MYPISQLKLQLGQSPTISLSMLGFYELPEFSNIFWPMTILPDILYQTWPNCVWVSVLPFCLIIFWTRLFQSLKVNKGWWSLGNRHFKSNWPSRFGVGTGCPLFFASGTTPFFTDRGVGELTGFFCGTADSAEAKARPQAGTVGTHLLKEGTRQKRALKVPQPLLLVWASRVGNLRAWLA